MNAAKERRHNEVQLNKIKERVAETPSVPQASAWSMSSLREMITAHPLPAVAIGAGLGLFVGAILRRVR